MCGAFSILHPFREVGRHFNAGYNEAYDFPRYNARPTHKLPIVIRQEGENRLIMAQWGLTPSWMKGKVLFNTRDESVATKPYFERIFQSSRCLVPADGFYEWRHAGGTKQPYRILLKTESVFAFAGICAKNQDANELQFSIITTDPNELVVPIHNRMPVIISELNERRYLESSDVSDLIGMLRPYPPELMKAYPVSTLVNSAKNDAPEIIEPLGQ